jgi:hypothetical protein
MNPTTNTAENPFKPTAAMIKAAESVFLAMAFEQSVRSIVESYQQKILQERAWRCDPDLVGRMERRSSDQPVEQNVTDIKSIKSTWMMEKADFVIYLERCNAERIAAGLVVEHDSYCPLLVAEHITIQAKHALCDAMASVTNITAVKAAPLQLNVYRNFVDLNLRLLAPFVTNPLANTPA